MKHSDNQLNPAVYAADLAKTIAAEQAKLENLPDWWQQVVTELHSQLQQQLEPPCDSWWHEAAAIPQAGCNPPWKGDSAPADLTDCFSILREVSYEQGCHDDRLNGLEKSIAAIEDWADIRYLPNEQGDHVTNNCIHELIADGMTGVTADMQSTIDRLEQRNAECLRTVYEAINAVAGSAKPEIDRLNKRIDEIGDVLIKALLQIDALEAKAPR